MLIHANDANRLKAELIYPDLSYKITGLFYAIHNELGRFLLERQYADSLAMSLEKAAIPYEREVKVSIDYENKQISAGVADFVIDNKIIVDLKAKKFITKEDYNQMMRYLKAKKIRLGMIVNFRSTYLKPRRILNKEVRTLA